MLTKRALFAAGCALLALVAAPSRATTLALMTPARLHALSRQADRGDTAAMVEIGEAYHFGLTAFHARNPADDRTTAIAWYERAAAQGSARAARDLGYLYEDDTRWPGISADLPRARAWYARAAQAGDVLAESWLASFYETKGPPPAYLDAYRWRLKAARQGDTQSRDILDELYTAGCDVSSFDAAFARIEAAAKAGDSDAQWRLGLIIQDESLGPYPHKAAGLDWLKTSAAADNAKGLFYLARVTYTAGAHPDVDAGIEPLLAQTADKGYFPAQDWWARLHTTADAVPDRTEHRIFEWYRIAAEQGYEIAQASLAAYYDKGMFVPVDRAEAYKWSLLSWRSPVHDGVHVEIVHDATPAERREGQARADAWLAAHPQSYPVPQTSTARCPAGWPG